jgi:hypothetical protein
MALAPSQKSLKNWSAQKWRTKSGKKSSVTGERYLPEKVIDCLQVNMQEAQQRKERTEKEQSTVRK